MLESYWLGFIERNNLQGLACCAANYNNTDLVFYLCRNIAVPIFAIPLNERRHCGTDADVLGYWTPLSHAILGKHEELALALIGLPNQELNCPETKASALHLAAHAGMLRLARQLVQRHGLNFDTLDKHGYIPIVTVVALAHLPIVEFLLEQCRGRSRLEKVLEKACRGNGMPLLSYCCVKDYYPSEEARVAVARAAVTRWGADIWAIEPTTNATALQVAAICHDLALVDFFITECKIPVKIGEEYSGTPLRNACRRVSSNAFKMVKCLVENLGADPTLRDGDGLTSAGIASQKGMPEVQEYLSTAASVYKSKPLSAERVTIMAAVPDADTECREEASSAHSSCAGSLIMADAQPELVGLMERQNWLWELR